MSVEASPIEASLEDLWTFFDEYHDTGVKHKSHAVEAVTLKGRKGRQQASLQASKTTGRGHGQGPNGNDTACENCGWERLQVEEGAHVCCKCNYMQSRVIDNGAEWRFYGAEDNRDDDPTRCGMPSNPLLPHSSLGSMVGGRWNDSRDNRRIRQHVMWNSMPYWERTLYGVFEKLSGNANHHGIYSKVLNDAKVFYKTASEKKISRADHKDGLIAACLYFACAANKCSRSTKEIAKMFNLDHGVLTKGNNRFQSLIQVNVESSGPEDFIGRFGSRLNMDYGDILKCKALTRKMDELELLDENAPTSVAASIIYFYVMANELDISKKHIAETCEVSEVTITKCVKKMSKHKEALSS
jgi:transcription initiation factor TFIIB